MNHYEFNEFIDCFTFTGACQSACKHVHQFQGWGPYSGLLCCCALTHGGLLTVTSDLPVEGQKVNIGQSVLLLQRLHGDDVEMWVIMSVAAGCSSVTTTDPVLLWQLLLAVATAIWEQSSAIQLCSHSNLYRVYKVRRSRLGCLLLDD